LGSISQSPFGRYPYDPNAKGWLVLHESGIYECSTEAGTALFA
jgi:hypothetical protein